MLRKIDSIDNAEAHDNLNRGITSPFDTRHTLHLTPEQICQTVPQLQSPYASHVSPSNTISSEFLTPDLASVRWLDLLATDALQANRGFTRPSTPVYEPAVSPFDTQEVVAQQGRSAFDERPRSSAASEGLSWQLDRDIALKNSEISIFRNFVDHIALWVSHLVSLQEQIYTLTLPLARSL